MVFLCFSSKDRNSFAESIYYHLSNFGIPSWYDRKEILMGDQRDYKNFVEGVESCEYAVIVLSPNSIASVCANEEIDLIYERYLRNEVYVFPVFFNIIASDVPEKYAWMKKLVYKELDKTNDSRSLCNHIICKVLEDNINKLPLKIINNNNSIVTDPFLQTINSKYVEIDGINYNSRITLLYSGIIYILHNMKTNNIPDFCTKGANYIFDETKLNLKMDLRETKMIEYSYIILLNYFSG